MVQVEEQTAKFNHGPELYFVHAQLAIEAYFNKISVSRRDTTITR